MSSAVRTKTANNVETIMVAEEAPPGAGEEDGVGGKVGGVVPSSTISIAEIETNSGSGSKGSSKASIKESM